MQHSLECRVPVASDKIRLKLLTKMLTEQALRRVYLPHGKGMAWLLSYFVRLRVTPTNVCRASEVSHGSRVVPNVGASM
jgi:hypothetical protein